MVVSGYNPNNVGNTSLLLTNTEQTLAKEIIKAIPKLNGNGFSLNNLTLSSETGNTDIITDLARTKKPSDNYIITPDTNKTLQVLAKPLVYEVRVPYYFTKIEQNMIELRKQAESSMYLSLVYQLIYGGTTNDTGGNFQNIINVNTVREHFGIDKNSKESTPLFSLSGSVFILSDSTTFANTLLSSDSSMNFTLDYTDLIIINDVFLKDPSGNSNNEANLISRTDAYRLIGDFESDGSLRIVEQMQHLLDTNEVIIKYEAYVGGAYTQDDSSSLVIQ